MHCNSNLYVAQMHQKPHNKWITSSNRLCTGIHQGLKKVKDEEEMLECGPSMWGLHTLHNQSIHHFEQWQQFSNSSICTCAKQTQQNRKSQKMFILRLFLSFLFDKKQKLHFRKWRKFFHWQKPSRMRKISSPNPYTISWS